MNLLRYFNFIPLLPHIALVCLALTCNTLRAEIVVPGKTVVLSAPAPVLAIIKAHFELPDTLPDETAQAAFMRRAQRDIGELLATEGYFTPDITLRETNGSLTLGIVPGQLTRVTRLNIQFSGDISKENFINQAHIEELRATWKLKVGSPFRSHDWEEAKAALLSEVAQEDYPAAKMITSVARVDPATLSAELTVLVDSGAAFHFGALEIVGLDRYDKQLVMRQRPFKPGDPYRRDLLLTFQAQLQNMPQFASVQVNIAPDSATPEAVPVRVTITEAQSRRLGVGVGISTNNGARSEINYLDHNFLDHAWNFTSVLRLEQNRQSLSAGIATLPDDDGYLLSWGMGDEASLIAGLRTERKKLGVTRSRTLGQIETQIGIDWQQERRIPNAGIHQINQSLVLDWQWHRRALDDLLYPRNGNVTEFRFGGGSKQFLSDQDFFRSYMRQQFWWPIKERDVLNLRGEFAFTAARSRLGIPQEYLFRAGGSQSVRGYAYQSLGIREGAAIVGGRALATGSLEYTHWLSTNWGVALFTDVGGVSDDTRLFRLVNGYGSGARWRSPAGPLALDLAWGQQSNSLQLHFSIAATF